MQNIDGATVMTILTVFGLFGYLWWWGRQPNTILDKALNNTLEDGYEPDDSKPILKPPVYNKSDLRRAGKDVKQTLPQEDFVGEHVEADPVVAARPKMLEPTPRPKADLYIPSHKDGERPPSMGTPIETRKDAPVALRADGSAPPIKPVVKLLQKYGTHALSDPMSIEDLRKFVHDMIPAGYVLKKVWPSRGSEHLAYFIFED